MPHAIWDGELGGSFSILRAGYNIGALQPSMYLREFRSRDPFLFKSETCPELAFGAGTDPTRDTTHNLYDIIFHKHQRDRPTLPGADERVALEAEWVKRREQLERARGTFTPVSAASQLHWLRWARGWSTMADSPHCRLTVHPTEYADELVTLASAIPPRVTELQAEYAAVEAQMPALTPSAVDAPTTHGDPSHALPQATAVNEPDFRTQDEANRERARQQHHLDEIEKDIKAMKELLTTAKSALRAAATTSRHAAPLAPGAS